MRVLSNIEVKEGTVSSPTTLTFNFRVKQVIITNDSATADLSFKLNPNDASYATLKPTETLTMDVTTSTILVNGSSVPYRIWGLY